MKIGALISAGSQLILGRPTTVIPGSADGAKQAKSLGEAPPVRLNPSEIGRLATYFAQGGLIDRLKKRLNLLKNKKCVVVPADNWCYDANRFVYCCAVDCVQR